MEKLTLILRFIAESFIHIWPYLLITIPVAVIINITGASLIINRSIGRKPLISILLATLVGAISPFCSCGVIPVISSLLIGGVPIAPVMSFWLASPSMDPEIFFLSTSVLGWKLAVWRLAATFFISFMGGIITYFATWRGFIGSDAIRKSVRQKENCNCEKKDSTENKNLKKSIAEEIIKSTLMVGKFMFVAFLISAVLKYLVPGYLITSVVSVKPAIQVLLATLTGIPFYTSNISALPLMGTMTGMGLSGGAALAFLIAGSTTTLPAMAAVGGIVKPRVFMIYIALTVAGAILSGFLYNIFNLPFF